MKEENNYFFHRNRNRASLEKLLSYCDADKLALAVWHIMAIKNGRSKFASYFDNFPSEAFTVDPTSKFYIWPWMLESVLNRGLATRKRRRQPNLKYKTLNVQDFNVISKLINLQHNIENYESGIFINQQNVVKSLYRLTHRQFPWQRGFAKNSILQKYYDIYFFEEAKAVFEKLYGVKFFLFLRFCFILFSQFLETPYFNLKTDLRAYGLDDDAKKACCKLISLPLRDAESMTQSLLSNAKEAGYQPSVFRRFPCLQIGNSTHLHLLCPFPDLLFNRMTEGLFYDFAAKSEDLSGVFSKRFENHCIRTLSASSGEYTTHGETNYGTKKRPFRTPDILLKLNDDVVAVFECKARKLPSVTLTSQDPLKSSQGFDELAKGIFQLWRFFYHSRTGKLTEKIRASMTTNGVLLTMDPWLETSEGFSSELYDRARTIEIAHGETFLDCDRRKITFMSEFDLQTILSLGTVDELLVVIEKSHSQEYLHWAPSSIFNTLFKGRTAVAKSMPAPSLGLIEVFPWLAN